MAKGDKRPKRLIIIEYQLNMDKKTLNPLSDAQIELVADKLAQRLLEMFRNNPDLLKIPISPHRLVKRPK